jgi:hypothetical protein
VHQACADCFVELPQTAVMAKLTPSSFMRYAALDFSSPKISRGSFMSASSNGIGISLRAGFRRESSSRLAAPGTQRRSKSTLTCSSALLLCRKFFEGRTMDLSCSTARYVHQGDINDCLTWHYVPVPTEPQSQRSFRKHICLEVCSAFVGSDALAAWQHSTHGVHSKKSALLACRADT